MIGASSSCDAGCGKVCALINTPPIVDPN